MQQGNRSGASNAIELRGILIGALVALVGSMGGTYLVVHSEADRQTTAIDEQRASEMRNLQRPIYSALWDTANAYGTTEVQRRDCVPGTDERRNPEAPCSATFESLEHARYAFQTAINDLYLIGTPGAIAAMRAIAETMPGTLVGAAGDPVEGAVDEEALDLALREFRVVSRCDLNPVVAPDCES